MQIHSSRYRQKVDSAANSILITNFMLLNSLPRQGRPEFQIDVFPEKDQRYQSVRIFGKDRVYLDNERSH